MRKFFRHKIGMHSQPTGMVPSDRVVTALVMTILLFAVVNAYRNPPDLVAQLDKSTGAAAENTASLDKLFRKITASGNIVLRYEGFDYSTRDKQEKVTFEYIRAAYATYPRRIYVADATTPVPQTETEYLVGDPWPAFNPSKTWLDDHQVVATITARRQPDGTTRYYELSHTQP